MLNLDYRVMNEKKHIDRLFQEKFKDFEVAPNDAVWNRINENLPNKKKKRRIIPIWWQIGGVAATIALLITIGVSIFNSNSSSTVNPVIVDTEEKHPTNNIENDDTSSEYKTNTLNPSENSQNLQLVTTNKTEDDSENTSSLNSEAKENSSSHALTKNPSTKTKAVANQNKNSKTKQPKALLNNRFNKRSAIVSTENNTKKETSEDKSSLNKTEIQSAINKSIEENNTAVAENTKTSDNNSVTNTTEKASELLNNEESEKASLLDAVAENSEDIDEKENDDEQNRWSITPNVAPVYFSSLGQGSTIHSQFNENSKNSEINMSYGISGSYAINNRLKIRVGVNRVNLNYATENVIAFNDANTQARGGLSQGNITFKNDTISMVSLETLNRFSSPEAFNTKISGEIDQRFGFIEVPLELEYRLIDKKLGLNVIGGFSTFILSQNEIYADIDGNSTLIGKASNINTTSFSANFGLGLDYSLSKQWQINLEPQFKYQINTFTNTFGDFRPFIIGIYTGLKFKF